MNTFQMSIEAEQEFEDLYDKIDKLENELDRHKEALAEMRDCAIALVEERINFYENKIKYIDEPKDNNWDRDERLSYYQKQIDNAKIRLDFILKKNV